jgi:hypothetical protein
MTTPNKTYDLKTAAAMFGMGHITFYEILRGESKRKPLKPSWLHAGTFRKDPANNTPKEWAKKAGYLATETRGRPAPYNHKITLLYHVSVITRHGIMALEQAIQQKALLPPKLLALTTQNAIAAQAKNNKQQANKEREKCLQELAAMGLHTSKVS